MNDQSLIKRRIEASVIQAQMNARQHGGKNAEAAMDLMCAFVLVITKSGGDPEKALATSWKNAKAVVSDFWPDERIN